MGETLIILFAALVVDRLVGDPDWLWRRVPHPVVGFGRLIGWADARFNDPATAESQREKYGFIAIAALLVGAAVLGSLMDDVLEGWGGLGLVAETLIVAVFLAQKSLADHVGAVARAPSGSDHGGLLDASDRDRRLPGHTCRQHGGVSQSNARANEVLRGQIHCLLGLGEVADLEVVLVPRHIAPQHEGEVAGGRLEAGGLEPSLASSERRIEGSERHASLLQLSKDLDVVEEAPARDVFGLESEAGAP